MQNDNIKLLAVGDILFADTPLKLGSGVKSLIKKKGYNYFISRIKYFTDNHDLCFGNLESVLSDVGYNKLKISSVEIRGETGSVEILKKSGFNIINVANNHIFQHGLAAYTDTINALRDNNIGVIGNDLSDSKLFIYEKEQIKVGFVGYSLHHEQYRPNEKCPYALRYNYIDIIKEIENIKAEFDGFLVCSLHWGYEFLTEISIEQREFCHQLSDIGVNLVLGHHPHVPQAIENYNNTLIAYSLGNFVFDMDFEQTQKSFALSIEISEKGIILSTVVPFEISDDYCPYPLIGTKYESFLGEQHQLNEDVFFNQCSNDAELKVKESLLYKKLSKQAYVIFFKNLLNSNPWYSLSLILRAILRRLGFMYNP